MRLSCRGTVLWGMVSFFALASPQVADFEQPITFRQSAITVKQLLEALSRQTGVRLTAAPPIRDEFVLVAVEAMPLKELMEHLAYVTDGEWVEQEDGSHRLTRTPRVAQRRRAEDDAQILQRWRELFFSERFRALAEPLTAEQLRTQFSQIRQVIRNALDKHDPTQTELDSDTHRTVERAFNAMNPEYRLIARLLQQIDLKRFLEIPVGEKRVFSNVPGRYLTPFGFSVQPLLEQYLRERELLRTLWRSAEGFDEGLWNEFESRYRSHFFSHSDAREAMEAEGIYSCVYLEVERYGVASLWITLLLTDESQQAIRLAAFLNEEILVLQEALDEPKLPAIDKIEWSEQTRQFGDAARAFFRMAEAEALPALLDPARTEPLTLVPSDVLLTYAQHKKKNLVALVNESLANLIEDYIEGQTPLNLYVRTLMTTYEERETEKAVSLRPKWSSYGWLPRVDRIALSRLMHQILKDKHLRLQHFLEFAAITHQRRQSVAYTYVQLLDREFSFMSPRATAFLLSLTPAQRQALLTGESIALNQLSRPSREQLFRELYYVYKYISVTQEQGTNARVPEAAGILRYGWLHPLFPNGIPEDAQISLSARTKLGAFTERRAGVWSSFHDALRFAMTERFAKYESSSQLLSDFSQQEYERYRATVMLLANRKRYALTVRVGAFTISVSERDTGLTDFERVAGVDPFTLENLPEEFRKQVEEHKRRFFRDASEDP
ncbi:MAG: hypothetical protein K6U12_00060 [Armatimonadetes bacterium]|nr:hypothetical protein [Armatimonadota bacterium]CUU36723.1 hypothetical protein DCOP10_118158 [Armatimonadetes bacterium DC]